MLDTLGRLVSVKAFSLCKHTLTLTHTPRLYVFYSLVHGNMQTNHHKRGCLIIFVWMFYFVWVNLVFSMSVLKFINWMRILKIDSINCQPSEKKERTILLQIIIEQLRRLEILLIIKSGLFFAESCSIVDPFCDTFGRVVQMSNFNRNEKAKINEWNARKSHLLNVLFSRTKIIRVKRVSLNRLTGWSDEVARSICT